jgi:hypothetical protein
MTQESNTSRYVSLQLVKTRHKSSPIRTEKVFGVEVFEPEVGEPYMIHAPPLDPEMSIRVIRTSVVQKIEKGDGFILLETLNSTYKVESL